MARYETLMQIGNNWWKGYRLLVIDEVPEQIPQSFLPEVLSRCCQRFLSIELCVFSSEDRHRLSVGLLLRYRANNHHIVQGNLNDLSCSLIAQFKAQGFSIHLAESDDPVCQGIAGMFDSAQALHSNAVGFFPEEKLLGPMRFYTPGQYSNQSCLPIQWGRLTELLTRYPMSCMCIQLINTHLFPSEVQCLRENKAYFTSFPNDPYASAAGNVFDRLLRWINLPLLYVNMYCIGSTLFLEDAVSQMRLWRYCHYAIPHGAWVTPYYLFTGDDAIHRICKVLGHSAQCPVRFSRSSRMQRLTHLAHWGDVTALFPLPSDTHAAVGLKTKRYLSSPVQIPPESIYREGEAMILLGEQEETHTRLGMKLEDLRRHGFIVGKSGCGKTTFAMGLLYQLHKLGVPFLVIEPTKREYRNLLPKVDGLRIYTPGLASVSPISLNPFLPPKGITLQEYLPTITTIFESTISMDHPLDVIFPQVIRDCYTQYGWRLTSTRDSKGAVPFGMNEFIQCFQQYIRDKYEGSPEARGNLESGGVVRLTQLISEQPILFDTINSLDFDELLQHPTIIELDAIDNPNQKSLVMMTIIIQVMQCIRSRAEMDSRLQRIIMIDEAHLLLGNNADAAQHDDSRAASACVHFLQNMVKILRSYGTGIFFGDQSPIQLTRDIMEHVNLKIMFRQESPRERSMLAELTRMDTTMQEDMIDLPAGYGYVFLDQGLAKPVRLYTPNYKQTLELRNHVTNQDVARHMGCSMPAPFSQCACCTECAGSCDVTMRTDAFFIASRMMASARLSEILQQEHPQTELAEVFSDALPAEVEKCIREQDLPWHNERKLIDCTSVQLIRALLLSGRCPLPERELLALMQPAEPGRMPPASQPPQPDTAASKAYIKADLDSFLGPFSDANPQSTGKKT